MAFFRLDVVMCGDLVCQNLGECLDDFKCICPPEYTGPECEIRIGILNFIVLRVFQKLCLQKHESVAI